MILIFCGTPRFAVPTLERLIQSGHTLPLVVTQPDRPRGRGLAPAASPVKEAALRLGVPVIQPEQIRNNVEFREQLAAVRPDAIIVVGYGRIIPQWMIDLPRLGNLNLHASLLPRYRGAAPIQWAIANGQSVTGVTTMRIDAGLDTGDILQQREMPIEAEDTSETLSAALAGMGADLMLETLHGLDQGGIRPIPQDHTKASLAPILKREDGKIDFHRPASEIFNRLRGFQPWPGAYTSFKGRNLQVWGARPVARLTQSSAGTIVVEANQLFVACGEGTTIELLEVQIEGKRRMTALDFIHGYQPRIPRSHRRVRNSLENRARPLLLLRVAPFFTLLEPLPDRPSPRHRTGHG
jgi:methionyl-tRNA formyltransferase